MHVAWVFFVRLVQSHTLLLALAATEAPHCDPASVAHSDHDAEDSITGKIGDKVLVKCHKGYAGQGYAVCKATGKFDLPTCNGMQRARRMGISPGRWARVEQRVLQGAQVMDRA